MITESRHITHQMTRCDLVAWLMLNLLLLATGCGEASKKAAAPPQPSDTSTAVGTKENSPSALDASCPKTALHTGAFPEVRSEHNTPAYWLKRWPTAERDIPLLSADDITAHNRAVGHSGRMPISQWNLLTPMPPKELEAELQQRLSAMGNAVKNNIYVTESGRPLTPPDARYISRESGSLRGETQPSPWFTALQPIPMRCAPYNGALFTADSDMAFDKNACSTIQAQEPFEILGQWNNGMLFVRTRYAFGFIATDSAHSPDVPAAYRRIYMTGQSVWLPQTNAFACENEKIHIPARTILPVQNDNSLLLAHAGGFCSVPIPKDAVFTTRPLTRRAFYQTVFSYLGADYGFGGSDNGMDCSRFVMNVLSTFNLAMPRNSKHQSQSGAFSIDVSFVKDPGQKLNYLNLANQRGIVAIYFPGHIMFYLGETENGVPMAIHALGEYAKPCDAAPDAETVFRVKKVVVTDLSLGLGSSRKSFLERATRIVVFGATPGNALQAIVTHRAANTPVLPVENCDDSVNRRIFQSPRRLVTGEPARLIATSTALPQRTTLQIYDPAGKPVDHDVHALGGPPYTYWAQFSPKQTGVYTAVLGDGNLILACDRFSVRTYREKKKPRTEVGPYWENRWKWEQDTENLFSAFIEQLFDYDRDADVSWHGLQALLTDPERNLLFNHLGEQEDNELNLIPDCADLPYFLRAYFAWKTGLPFGVHSCSRGRKGRPPSCSEFQTNALEAPLEEELDSEAKIFERFANVIIGWNAHSASGRTHPKSSDTDFYPVALRREALSPGAIFADPYGHIMIISKWFPQPLGGYGILMAVDGQPDGTIGRRRFWRGDFLFDAATDSYGAGFKRFRPIEVVSEETADGTQRIPKPIENKELSKSKTFTGLGMEQYELGTDGFYTRMLRLINPRSLNAEELLLSRIDALFEAVKRRVQAIDNGESYMASHQYAPVEMPDGYSIFQSEGPWEDYSTPSRDMRLLIAIDAVTQTPTHVATTPKQYGITDSSEINRVVSHLQAVLDRQLQQMQIIYRRSDNSPWRLTLADVVSRARSLEMAYNPNDCPEYRWGAQEKSEEFTTCHRHAPNEQRSRMTAYRSWFETRKRPVRE